MVEIIIIIIRNYILAISDYRATRQDSLDQLQLYDR